MSSLLIADKTTEMCAIDRSKEGRTAAQTKHNAKCLSQLCDVTTSRNSSQRALTVASLQTVHFTTC